MAACTHSLLDILVLLLGLQTPALPLGLVDSQGAGTAREVTSVYAQRWLRQTLFSAYPISVLLFFLTKQISVSFRVAMCPLNAVAMPLQPAVAV